MDSSVCRRASVDRAQGTTEALAVQTLVANYNRISTGLGETLETWRPRFARRNDGSFDTFHWSTAFLLATGNATRLWRPVPRGHAATGDIIAPIRDTTGVNSRLDDAGVATVAKAIVAIRSCFMPKRVKAAHI
ncbi:MAG: hypothetical protein EOS26_11685 [Mesorhizobium sp.]|nr:MAG: hypothetical protein EOS26_11685 [Mesorhizobium sp.]